PSPAGSPTTSSPKPAASFGPRPEKRKPTSGRTMKKYACPQSRASRLLRPEAIARWFGLFLRYNREHAAGHRNQIPPDRRFRPDQYRQDALCHGAHGVLSNGNDRFSLTPTGA